MPTVVQRNSHVFHRVACATDQEVAAQRAGEADFRPGARLVVNVVRAFKIQLVPVKINAQGELAVEKPRFDEGKFVVLALGADLHAQPDYELSFIEPWF